MPELFSVCQFFEDGSYEFVKKGVGVEEAVNTFKGYATSVGAKIGTTVRVVIVDDGDCTNMEWKFGLGITFPPEHAGKLKGVS